MNIIHQEQLLNQLLTAVTVRALGYRAASDSYAWFKKVRFPKEQVLVNS